MKVEVKYEANETQRWETFDLEVDLGLSEEEWKEMSEDEKREILMDSITEQPYWMVDRFTEKQRNHA